MHIQIRTYTINRGSLHTFAREWRQLIKPLRIRFGFDVLGGWMVESTSQFVWILAYDGPHRWETVDSTFHHSEERHAMDPDPARNIARIENYFVASFVS